MSSFAASSSRSYASSTIDSTISQDHTGGREANERRFFASLGRQHKSGLSEDDKQSEGAIRGSGTRALKKVKENVNVGADSTLEKKRPIKFKDAVGRKFSFPFHLCATWAGMEELIRQAFLHVDGLGSHVADGHYDLIGPNGEIILPPVWETMIEPDWSITMHMWPMPEPRAGPQPAARPPPGHQLGVDQPSSVHKGAHLVQPSGPPPPPTLPAQQYRALPGPPPPADWHHGPPPPPSTLTTKSRGVPRPPLIISNPKRHSVVPIPPSPPPGVTETIGYLNPANSPAALGNASQQQQQQHTSAPGEVSDIAFLQSQSLWYPDFKVSKSALASSQVTQNRKVPTPNVSDIAPKHVKIQEGGPIPNENGIDIPPDDHFATLAIEDDSGSVMLEYPNKRPEFKSGLASQYLTSWSEGSHSDVVESWTTSRTATNFDETVINTSVERPGNDVSSNINIQDGIVNNNQHVLNEDQDISLESEDATKQNNLMSYSEDLLLIDFGSDSGQNTCSRQKSLGKYDLGANGYVTSSKNALDVSVNDDQEDQDQPMKNGADGQANHMALLYAQIEELKRENAALQESLTPPLPSRWVHMHRVSCDGQDGTSIYLDIPVTTKDKNIRHLEGRVRISEVDDYLEEHPDVAFIVYLDYECDGHSLTHRKTENKHYSKLTLDSSSQDGGILDAARSGNSFQRIFEGLQLLRNKDEILKQYLPFNDDDEDELDELSAPYLFYFHFRTKVDEQILKLEDDQRQQVQLLTGYIATHFDEEYAMAEDLFSKGLVSPRYLEFLFPPEEVVVLNGVRDIIGYQQTSNPRTSTSRTRAQTSNTTIGVSFDAETWEFDGNFRTTKTVIDVVYGKAAVPVKRIDSLHAYPLRYAPPGIEEKLRKRGETFWACRKHMYVTYSGKNFTNDSDFLNTRFMVDVATYWKIHNDRRPTPFIDQLGGATSQDELPEGNFALLLPANIYGFNMQEKKWVDLRLDCVSPIAWNKKAFETLAVDDDTKELITALVSNKLAAEKGTDLMAGKGNGLIVLLHGGPGTGKTLTAESVAEIAEKPLYRVTCGDLGIDPVKIEEYLDSVFHLGKIWDCVVLLDEADVFLEQRTLNDLSRNALVSVFLRALEYYDGILVLTSNRVGTFDEAFKSRIQLALHYESLNKKQRHQIWSNFIHHLDDMNDNIDSADLLAHMAELSQYEMNGRQIRNALTTARQLALFKEVKMDFGHLKHVIKVSAKFDKYLFQLNAEATDEDWAREERIR